MPLFQICMRKGATEGQMATKVGKMINSYLRIATEGKKEEGRKNIKGWPHAGPMPPNKQKPSRFPIINKNLRYVVELK